MIWIQAIRRTGTSVHRRLLPAFVLTVTLALSTGALSTTTRMSVGSFDATGTGTLVAQGSLTAFGKIDGSFVVRDTVGGAMVRLNGIAQRPRVIRLGLRPVRVFTIRKAKGSFYIRGLAVRIELKAPVGTLSTGIIGRGRILRLDGDGTYTLNTEPTAEWAGAPLPLRIRPPRKVMPEPTRTTTATAPTEVRA
jgi:hypothetical protein